MTDETKPANELEMTALVHRYRRPVFPSTAVGLTGKSTEDDTTIIPTKRHQRITNNFCRYSAKRGFLCFGLVTIMSQLLALLILSSTFPTTPMSSLAPLEAALIPWLPFARTWKDGHFRTSVFAQKWLYWPLTRARRRLLLWQQHVFNSNDSVLFVRLEKDGEASTQRLLLSKIPAKETSSTIRYVAIADTHLLHGDVKLPPGDVLIHCGDILVEGRGNAQSLVRDFGNWLRRQKETCGFRHVFVTGGNHDSPFESTFPSLEGKDSGESIKRLLGPGVVFVSNGEVVVDVGKSAVESQPQHRIYLSAASRGSIGGKNAAFQYATDTQADTIWSQVPPSIDILVTHGPPFGILEGNGAGCPVLLQHVQERIQPTLHIFGHVHQSPGVTTETIRTTQQTMATTTFINAAMVDFDYAVAHPPIVFDLKVER